MFFLKYRADDRVRSLSKLFLPPLRLSIDYLTDEYSRALTRSRICWKLGWKRSI